MAYQPVIDEDSCLAHGDCAQVAPDVFQIDEIAVVVGSAPLADLQAAARACPAGAISIVDSDSGETLSP